MASSSSHPRNLRRGDPPSHDNGEGNTLTYPWQRGMRADELLEYYEAEGFTDFTHARTGVACADCHMPYERVGWFKVSDHHVRVSNACQSCHRASETELEDRVTAIADQEAMRVLAMSLDESRLGQLLVRDPAYTDVERAADAGAPSDAGEAGDAGTPGAEP